MIITASVWPGREILLPHGQEIETALDSLSLCWGTFQVEKVLIENTKGSSQHAAFVHLHWLLHVKGQKIETFIHGGDLCHVQRC